MNSVRSNNISFKYQRFTTLGSRAIGIINSEFVAKTQFLCKLKNRRDQALFSISTVKEIPAWSWELFVRYS